MLLYLFIRKPSLVICSACISRLAHTTNFTPLIDIAKALGATYVEEIPVAMGQNEVQQYTSERFVQKIVLALAETAFEPTKEEMQDSPC
jgi:hypothetical protein